MASSKSRIINYILPALVSITLIISAYSTLIKAPSTPEINIPEYVVMKGDIEGLLTKNDLANVLAKQDLDGYITKWDLWVTNLSLDELQEDITYIRNKMKGTLPEPHPIPSPEYLLAEVELEATVVNKSMEFVRHWEPAPSTLIPTTPSQTPTPLPIPQPTGITPYDMFKVWVTLNVDSIISYMCEDPDFLKVGDEFEIYYYWDTPHYKGEILIEQLDLTIGDRVRTTIRNWSGFKDLESATFWEWQWEFPDEIELLL